jgi:hypothetical protein
VRPNSGAPRRVEGEAMAEKLSTGTRKRIAALFPEEDREKASRLLAAGCGSKLPFAETLGPSGLERIQFAALKLSGGSLADLRAAIKLAKEDWRDLLVAAGFAKDARTHKRWLADD